MRAHFALDSHPIERAVDVGCGAGPGGILIAAAHPDASVLVVDIDEAAMRLSRVNAALNGAGRAEARRSDPLPEPKARST